MENKLTRQEIKARIISGLIFVCLISAFAVCGYFVADALGIAMERRGRLIGGALLVYIILRQEKGALPKDFLEFSTLDRILPQIITIAICVLAVIMVIFATIMVLADL